METVTSTILLIGLRDPANDRAWSEFAARYQPMLVAFARRLGLKEDQAQDAAQETLIAFVRAYGDGRYDRDRGRLRTWLLGIAVNKIRDIQRRLAREIAVGGQDSHTGMITAIPDERSLSEAWDEEWRHSILRACLDEVRRQVKPVLMRAFELFVLQEWPADRVAAHLGISRDVVYAAKSRILTRLQETRKQLEENW